MYRPTVREQGGKRVSTEFLGKGIYKAFQVAYTVVEIKEVFDK